MYSRQVKMSTNCHIVIVFDGSIQVPEATIKTFIRHTRELGAVEAKRIEPEGVPRMIQVLIAEIGYGYSVQLLRIIKSRTCT